MGREVKRIALDFDWPINTIWKGYESPYRGIQCKSCDQTGLNPQTKKLRDDWYALDNYTRHAGWCYKLEQADVDVLVKEDRLIDFTHTWTKDKGWQKKKPAYHPTAKEVNEWAKSTFGHDAVNCSICVEARATRLGFYGLCKLCEGHGEYWCDNKYRKLAEKWKPIEPTEGEGYQIWETVSEGSPITPVFKTPEELAKWCASQTTGWYEGNSSYEQWLKFIGVGYAPSLISDAIGVRSGVEAC